MAGIDANLQNGRIDFGEQRLHFGFKP
jgi:hypothetical protein